MESRIAADNNVFRTRDERVADGSFELSPRLAVRERNSNLTYDVSYRPTYEKFFTTNGIDGVDHDARGVANWRITPADSLSASSLFTSTRRLRLIDERAPFSPAPSLQESDRELVNRLDANVGYRHSFSPVTSVNIGASVNDFNSRRSTDIDTRAYTGNVGLQRVLNAKTSVGLFASGRRRMGRGFIDTKTDVWTVAASVNRALSPTMNISIQAGPSFIRSTERRGSIVEKSSTSVFAEIKFDKSWRKTRFDASYTRSESRSGGEVASSIFDNVVAQFTHTFDRRWQVRGVVGWNQREEVSQVTGRERLKIGFYQGLMTVTRTITPRVAIIGQYVFSRQSSNGSNGVRSIGDVHTGFLSLRYTFDPFDF